MMISQFRVVGIGCQGAPEFPTISAWQDSPDEGVTLTVTETNNLPTICPACTERDGRLIVEEVEITD